jgi:hypothetical protein
MGAGGAPPAVQETSLAHLIDPTRKWYNNRRWALHRRVALCRRIHPHLRRLITLNAWIVLLYVRKKLHFPDFLTS